MTNTRNRSRLGTTTRTKPRISEDGLAVALLLLVVGLTASLVALVLSIGPRPLTVDEGYNGVDALRTLDAGPVWFYAANNGREPLYVILAALSTALFGPSSYALRLPAAIAGVLRVVAVFGVTRAVLCDEEPGLARWVPLLSALTAAVSLWGLTLSGLALRVGLLPLLVSLCVWWLWWALRSGASARHLPYHLGRRVRRCVAYAGAGFAAGLTVYTYLAWRVLPLLLAVVLAHLAWQRRDWIRSGWRGLVLAGLVAGATATPLLLYYREHATAMNMRVGQVAAIGGGRSGADSAEMVLSNLANSASMFVLRGDPYELYNVLARPVFPPVTAVFFLLGLIVLLMRWRNPSYGIWLWWVAVFLLPGVLADRTPHFARQVGVMPAVFVYPALGVWAVLPWLRRGGLATRKAVDRWRISSHDVDKPRKARRSWPAAAIVVVIVYVLGTLAPTLRDINAVYDGGNRAVAELLSCECLAGDGRLMVAASERIVTATDYLSDRDRRLYATHGFNSVVLPWFPNGRTVFLIENDWYADRAEAGVREVFELVPWNRGAEPDGFRGLTIDGRNHSSRFRPPPYVLTDLGAQLTSYALPEQAEPGGTVTLSLQWLVRERPEDDPSEDYTWFVHLIDDEHRVVAQQDWLGYPTHAWGPGDRVLSWFDLRVADDAQCASAHVEIGMYSRASGRRVGLEWSPVAEATIDRSGTAMPVPGTLRDDRAVFGEIQIVCGDDQ